MRTKVTYGFLILALGLMLTDVCRLTWPPTGAASSAASLEGHTRKL